MAEEDLIFGKERHFFGGIEPANMNHFSATSDAVSGKVRLSVSLPEDTIIDNQTLCSVEGVVIRRKVTDYPIDEFDGDLVVDLKRSTVSYIDQGASSDGVYYYSAFPYSTQGVFNRNPTNRITYGAVDEHSSLLLERDFNTETNEAAIQLKLALPSDAAGAIIKRSTTGFPASVANGKLVGDVSESKTITDSSVESGNTYYYSAFVYDENKQFKYADSSKVSGTFYNCQYFFGYDLETSERNPSNRVHYPPDVDNANYERAYMDFKTGSFKYGSWPKFAGEKFIPRPCMLTYDGSVDHYLDQNDYSKRVNGGDSAVSDPTFNGNAMMEWSKIYVKRWMDGNVYKFRMSDTKIDNDYECWSNYDRNDNIIEHFYTPIYFGSFIGDRLRSLSNTVNGIGHDALSEIDAALKNGNESWYTEVMIDRLLIIDILTMMGKSTDLQTIFGNGVCDSNSPIIRTGIMDSNGLFWGSSSMSSGVKVLGMENLWGNINRRIAGLVNDHGMIKIKMTSGIKDGSSIVGYNPTGLGYVTAFNAEDMGTKCGYISECFTTRFGRIPCLAKGSSTTFESDYISYKNDSIYYPSVGGGKSNLQAGPFAIRMNDTSNVSSSYLGTSVSCKPLASV